MAEERWPRSGGRGGKAQLYPVNGPDPPRQRSGISPLTPPPNAVNWLYPVDGPDPPLTAPPTPLTGFTPLTALRPR